MQATFACDRCGAAHPLEDRFMVGEDQLCPDCASNYTILCDECGRRIYIDDDEGDDSYALCRDCRERYYTCCDRCGTLVHNDHVYEYDDEYLCRDCYDDACSGGPIHEYDYVPELIFHGKGLRRFGVELEIDEGGKSRANANRLLEIANRDAVNLYVKSDGSLDDGLELVTHPMTLEYHLQEMPWAEVLSEAKRLNYRSHSASTCGLHVHISRMAFGCTYETQAECIARLVFFVEKFWPELLRFSRRTQGQLNRWAARYGYKEQPMEILDHAKKGYHGGRYTCVNLTNQDTIEFRMFRGTLKSNTLIATLQLVDRICDVAIYLSDDELKALSWTTFVSGCQAPELVRYLKERRLYVNEPVMAEAEV